MTDSADNFEFTQYGPYIDFAAAAAIATLPAISSVHWTNHTLVVSANFRPGPAYSLLRIAGLNLTQWQSVFGVLLTTNGGRISLAAPSPPSGGAFYRVAETVAGQ